jgi:hypothetical protein
LSRKLRWTVGSLEEFHEYPVWFRLEYFFNEVADATVVALFEKVSEEMLLKVHERVLQGSTIASKDARQFISDLVWLNKRAPKIFWSRPEKPGVSLRRYILSILHDVKAKEIREQKSGAFATDPEKSMEALLATERTLLEVTSQNPATQSFGLRRFVQPLYTKVLGSLKVVDYVRAEAQVIRSVDDMAQTVLDRRVELGLTGEEAGALEKTLRDTLGQFQEIQVLIAQNFGVSVAKGNPIPPEDIDVYQMHGGLDPDSVVKHTDDAFWVAFADVNRIDNVLDSASMRAGRDVYPVEEMPTLPAQIRFDIRQYALSALSGLHKEIIERNPGLTYKDEWTETEKYRTAFGTRTRKISRSAIRTPTYRNIINDDFEVRGKATGLEEIRKDAALMIEHERPMQAPVFRSRDLLQKFLADIPESGYLSPEPMLVYRGEIAASLETLLPLQGPLLKYAQTPDAEIVAQW